MPLVISDNGFQKMLLGEMLFRISDNTFQKMLLWEMVIEGNAKLYWFFIAFLSLKLYAKQL
jgi:hypothetical protein